ncbi:hypothetical protein GCM10022284_20550 [Streptomyces hundungensis]
MLRHGGAGAADEFAGTATCPHARVARPHTIEAPRSPSFFRLAAVPFTGRIIGAYVPKIPYFLSGVPLGDPHGPDPERLLRRARLRGPFAQPRRGGARDAPAPFEVLGGTP